MTAPQITRRGLLTASLGLGAGGLLAGCVGASSNDTTAAGSSSGSAGGPLVFQNSIQDAAPKAALEKIVAAYPGGNVTMNSVATEQFRAQLTNYLRSSNPPDVMSWYAGSVARDYASQGLLLDVSSLWTGDGACANFSDALKNLSSTKDGTQIFVPTNYYWWSVFYKKSAFAKWGVQPPTTWEEFHTLCQTLKGKGVIPLTNGIGPTPWMASGWFDYLDLRINGADYHRDLLAGKHAFTDPEVKDVMKEYKGLIPYFDPNMASYDAQEGATPLIQDKAAMYLIGAFVTGYFPQDQRDDIDFFSVPVINPSVPSAEEAPTDGFFAASGTSNPEGTKKFLSYLAAPAQQQAFISQSQSANLPTSPDVDTSSFSPLVKKGIDLLNNTKQITQFFNRDSSDALQATADTALTKFLANPGQVDQILADWQKAAEQVWKQ